MTYVAVAKASVKIIFASTCLGIHSEMISNLHIHCLAGLYLYHNLPIVQIHNYILAIRSAVHVPIPIPIFMAGCDCINLHDIIVLSSNYCIPYLACLQNSTH